MRKILLILILISIPTLGLTWTDSTGSTQTATTTDYDVQDILDDVYDASLGMIKTSATSVNGGTTTVISSYLKDKTLAVNVGKTSSTGLISDTAFNLSYYAFNCSGDATIVATGGFSDTLYIFKNRAQDNPFPIPTSSSVTFNVSALTSGTTLEWTLNGVK